MIPISTLKSGMFFTHRGALYYTTRLKANGKPEVRKMLYSECRWLPPQTAYGVNKAEFHSPDALVTPLNNEQVLKWNLERFVRETKAMKNDSDRHTLRKLEAKALAPAVRWLRENSVLDLWDETEIRLSLGYAETELRKSLRGGPDSVAKTTTALITQNRKAEQAERRVQALLAELHEAVQLEADGVELDDLWDLFSHARQEFEFTQREGISPERRKDEAQGVTDRVLNYVRQKVAREKGRRAVA